ncbi:MAG: MSMEG_4193 family putative phosphomutase [Chloroflexota bacterium]|nr:MSMEG_4193 family putative phosphomutase [Anaerolineales bacterium]
MAIIALVRHGENDWVKKHRLAGWIPGVHLNENGHKQAAAAAERLAALPLKALYSSPVTRCMETAVYIAQTHHLDIVEIEELGEVRYGKWEGKKIEKLAKKKAWHAVQHFPSRFRFPEGESLHEVQFRAVQALETLNHQHPKELIAVVSHADLIKMVLAHYLGVHLDLFQRIVISPASISIIALGENGGVQIVRLNDTGPLQFPAAPHEKKQQGHDEEE